MPALPEHSVRDGDRFRIEHGADYSIAFSYDTPREPAYRQECIELIAGLVRRALDLLRPAIRKQAWYADLSAKAGTP
jgi:hypothetical protein